MKKVNSKYRFPPRFLLGLSSGIARGFFNFAGGGSYIFSNLFNILFFIVLPSSPFGDNLEASILAALAQLKIKLSLIGNYLVESILTSFL